MSPVYSNPSSGQFEPMDRHFTIKSLFCDITKSIKKFRVHHDALYM